MSVMGTGGAGMLGLHVARALAEQGQSVVALVMKLLRGIHHEHLMRRFARW